MKAGNMIYPKLRLVNIQTVSIRRCRDDERARCRFRMLPVDDAAVCNSLDAPESQQTLEAFERLAPLLSGVSG